MKPFRVSVFLCVCVWCAGVGITSAVLCFEPCTRLKKVQPAVVTSSSPLYSSVLYCVWIHILCTIVCLWIFSHISYHTGAASDKLLRSITLGFTYLVKIRYSIFCTVTAAPWCQQI